MSYYYNYYLAYKGEDNKLHPLGLKDQYGKYKTLLWNSSSFDYELNESFFPEYSKEDLDDELVKQFEYKNYEDEIHFPGDGDGEHCLEYCSISNLPSDDFIKKGYFLKDDVTAFERKTLEPSDLFYEYLTPLEYAAALEDEVRFGPPQPKTDEYGDTYTEHSVRDYMYYAYADYYSKEYLSHLLKVRAQYIIEDSDLDYRDSVEYVIILNQG